ncbi:hypothetical protein L596_025743 [Steinernema carpocapsae]|uniref:Uncharacterized protein n=1 Tax=Steinernema carpocapsae TaxID=34508 RepID=A0A4U5M8R6_STECR|nr:hypothetical protein L596_025743 [Steinernema carpocapsae]
MTPKNNITSPDPSFDDQDSFSREELLKRIRILECNVLDLEYDTHTLRSENKALMEDLNRLQNVDQSKEDNLAYKKRIVEQEQINDQLRKRQKSQVPEVRVKQDIKDESIQQTQSNLVKDL